MKLIPKAQWGRIAKVAIKNSVKASSKLGAFEEALKGMSNLPEWKKVYKALKKSGTTFEDLGITDAKEIKALESAIRRNGNVLPEYQEAYNNALNKIFKGKADKAIQKGWVPGQSGKVPAQRFEQSFGSNTRVPEGKALVPVAKKETALVAKSTGKTGKKAAEKIVPKKAFWKRAWPYAAAAAGATALYPLLAHSDSKEEEIEGTENGDFGEYPQIVETSPQEYGPISEGNQSIETTPQQINPSIINRLQPTQQAQQNTNSSSSSQSNSDYPLQSRKDIRRMFKSKGVKDTVGLVRAVEGDAELKKAVMNRLGITSWNQTEALQKLNQLGIHGSVGGSDRKRFRVMLNRGYRNGGTLYKLVPKCY